MIGWNESGRMVPVVRLGVKGVIAQARISCLASMKIVALLHRIAGGVYRSLAAPLGIGALDRSLRNGLPAQLGPALRFLFDSRLPEPARLAAERVEALRATVAAQPDRFHFVSRPSPLGPVRWPERLPEGQPAGETISARDLAHRISVNRRWGVFLHLVCEGFAARTVLETGACIGISGAYLASTPARPRLVTVEGSSALAALATSTLASITDRASVVAEPFETGIGNALSLLAAEGRCVDLAYIDGHHDQQATLHYLRQIQPHLSANAVVVLDDIHLYTEMWSAWQTILARDGFTAAVNTGRFGILVWKGSAAVTTAQYDLARYTGWWRVGRSRLRSLHAPE